MSRRVGYVVAAAILTGSLALANFMVSLRPEPARREPPSRVPFAITEPVVAAAGAIPVYGGRDGTAERADRRGGGDQRPGRVGELRLSDRRPGWLGPGAFPPRRRRAPSPSGAGARRCHRAGGRAAEGRGRGADRPRPVRAVPTPAGGGFTRRGHRPVGAMGTAVAGGASCGRPGSHRAGRSRAGTLPDRCTRARLPASCGTSRWTSGSS